MNTFKKNIPNIISTLRIMLAIIFPFIFIANKINLAFIIFVTAAISDALDGFLARKWNVISDYGKRIDPIADKYLSCSALILISIFENALLSIVLILEFIIIINNILLYAKKKNIYVSKSGKIKTVLLFSTIAMALISIMDDSYLLFLYILLISTIILQLISIRGYVNLIINNKI